MALQKPEVWQRGPVAGIPPLLQPVAHALLQSREEVNEIMTAFPADLLWDRPAGMASPGFHLQHLSGVLDRIFTYARGESLTRQQLDELAAEGKNTIPGLGTSELVQRFDLQVDRALEQLTTTSEASLTDHRGLGRARLPTTVIGLLFHAAEHAMRHTGQLLVTVAVIREQNHWTG